MLNIKEFTAMRKDLERQDEIREKIISQSRVIIHLSKRIIYAAQRGDLKTAQPLAKDITTKITQLRKTEIPLDTDIATVAYQEYVEALTFFHFVKTGKMLSKKELGVTSQEYLLGLCDLTGELVRKAVDDVIHKRFAQAKKGKELVSEIYGAFLKMNLRNGELRKKSDQIKWNLKKLEDVMYDISLKSKR